VKESVFNVIREELENCTFLDLFAGSGSIGIEAISRGAQNVYFIDNSIKSIRLINENLDMLKSLKTEFTCNCKVLKSDIISFLKINSGLYFDIIFIDPPYKISAEYMSDVFKTIIEGKFTGGKTLLIYEYFFKRDIMEELSGLRIEKKSYFGDKIVSYIAE
jgi:16S rRNA (guanine966-N2)-methyltransferase